MKQLLVVGRGDIFRSFVQMLSHKRLDWDEVIHLEVIAYYRECIDGIHIYEGFRRVATEGFATSAAKLCKYEQVYLFPDDIGGSLRLVEFFAELGTCRLYVLTRMPRYAHLYKRMGAHQVFVSKPGYLGYHWLVQNIEEEQAAGIE
ncbi:hypothetical protein [Brevibacillus daliensis]|uniref:hypothetical protein n=1 Tax=Brevibacillus daliensis TaxID=2892995 RepID=UPI001E2943AA|nr:hypothetical protein [Brevibacillus daliensis]